MIRFLRNHIPDFVLLVGLAFFVPWFVMVVQVLSAQKITPESYNKDRDGMEGIFPGKVVYRQGQLVYQREGCVQCHTQMIRPSFQGVTDGWKKGWGSDQSATPRDVIRPNVLLDYYGEPVAPLGIMRVGPDLANYGYRAPMTKVNGEEVPDTNAMHLELFAPKAVHDWSVMPSYRNLYIVRDVEGMGAADALKFPEGAGPGAGKEVVPTPEANELIKYLLSLKKDAPIPGQVPVEAK
jgi:cbb3-type cytochrome oxidase cytochrome c subunit